MKASLPGVKPDDIHSSVTGDVLTLRGEVKEEKAADEVAYHIRVQETAGVVPRPHGDCLANGSALG